jgi:tetratricopeptide (TPR) repeat protein
MKIRNLTRLSLWAACIFVAAASRATADTPTTSPTTNIAKEIDPARRDAAAKYLKLAEPLLKKGEMTDEATSELIGVQAKLGDVRGALARVDGVDDLFLKASALSYICGAQLEAGDKTGAAATVGRAVALEGRDPTLGIVAEMQGSIGDFKGAERTIDQITAPDEQAESLSSLASIVTSHGDPATAKRLLSAAFDLVKPRPLDEDWTFTAGEVALWMAKSGDIDGASAALAQGRDADDAARLRIRIALTDAGKGWRDDARRLLGQWQERVVNGPNDKQLADSARVTALLAIAQLWTELDRPANAKAALVSALKLAEPIADSEPGLESLGSIAVAMANTGDHAEAVHILDETVARAKPMVADGAGAYALWTIAMWESNSGMAADVPRMVAAAMATGNVGLSSSCNFVMEIARGMAAEQGPSADLSWIDKLKTDDEKYMAFCGAAQGMLDPSRRK